MHRLLVFRDPKLLQQALTHSSFANQYPEQGEDNERLEFLGDALLTFFSAEYLYCRYPGITEGEMTQRRSYLVDEPQLAHLARLVEIPSQIRLGRGLQANDNLLSSALEAVVGAYYLDRGHQIEPLREIITELFDAVPGDLPSLDPKSQFQVWVQANFATLPTYITLRIGGSDHNPEYLAKVLVKQQVYGQGWGRGKKAAERQAAEAAIHRISNYQATIKSHEKG